MIFRYYWQDIDTQVSRIRIGIKRLGLTPDLIVGITRGGLIPATLLAYKMELPVCSLQWQRRDLEQVRDHVQLAEILLASKTGVVIVDDVLDSGNTLREIDEYARKLQSEHDEYASVDYAVCVKRTELTSPVPNLIFGTELENFDWINFPWGQ